MTQSAEVERELLLQTRVAELEFAVAARDDDVRALTKEREALRQQVEQMQRLNDSTAPDLGRAAGLEDVYRLQYSVAQLTEERQKCQIENDRLQGALRQLRETTSAEVEKAQFEANKALVAVKEELEQQRTLCNELKHAAAVGEQRYLKELQLEGMNQEITHSIVIPSETLFYKLRADPRLSSATENGITKAKYGVQIEFVTSSHTIKLKGRRICVDLLKGELNELRLTMQQPLLSGHATTTRSETEALARTVAAHENAIAALHTAIQHAQERAKQSQLEAEEARAAAAVAEEKYRQGMMLCATKEREAQSRLDLAMTSAAQAEQASSRALAGLREEAAQASRYREENEKLKEQLRDALTGRDVAERSAMVTAEQLKAAAARNEELARTAEAGVTERIRSERLEEHVRAQRQELEETSTRLAREIGQLEAKLQQASEKMTRTEQEKLALQAALDASEAEVGAQRELVQELRQRLLVALHRPPSSDPATERLLQRAAPKPLSSYPNATQYERELIAALEVLHGENTSLKAELERSQKDMREIAHALQLARDNGAFLQRELEKVQKEKESWAKERSLLAKARMEEQLVSKHREAAANEKYAISETENAELRSALDRIQRQMQDLSIDNMKLRLLTQRLPPSADKHTARTSASAPSLAALAASDNDQYE